MSVKKAYEVARDFRIRIVEDHNMSKAGYYRGKRTIVINPEFANAYTVLHEIGHVFCGLMCCREHCEYAAHGVAIALARVYKIRIPKKDLHDIDAYAGRSTRKACAAISRRQALRAIERRAKKRMAR
jgi:hypothetical protein